MQRIRCMIYLVLQHYLMYMKYILNLYEIKNLIVDICDRYFLKVNSSLHLCYHY